MTQLRQSPRLRTFDYLGLHAYFVTSVTRERRPVLARADIRDRAVRCLREAAADFSFGLTAYCFMPDHLHVLAGGVTESSDLKEFMRQFKQRSRFHAKRITGAELWQISYHDRVLRNSEAIEDVARYIWFNPVRAGLVSDYRDWPGSGPAPLPELR